MKKKNKGFVGPLQQRRKSWSFRVSITQWTSTSKRFDKQWNASSSKMLLRIPHKRCDVSLTDCMRSFTCFTVSGIWRDAMSIPLLFGTRTDKAKLSLSI